MILEVPNLGIVSYQCGKEIAVLVGIWAKVEFSLFQVARF
jgi:hypothetical protein